MSATLSVLLLVSTHCLLAAVLVCSVRTWLRVRALPGPELARVIESLRAEIAALKPALERVKAERRTARNRVAPASRLHRIDPAVENAVPGPTLIAVPNLATSTEGTGPANEELGRRFAPVWSLADTGLSAEAIAERTGQPIGQVELILGLRRQLGTSHSVGASVGNRN